MERFEDGAAIEAAFVKTFIAPERQDRWLSFLPSPKNRLKILHRLAFCREDFDARFLNVREHLPVSDSERTAAFLKEWERENPAQLCHLIANSSDIDGAALRLPETEDNESLSNGAIIIVHPKHLAFWQTDGQPVKPARFVLLRPQR